MDFYNRHYILLDGEQRIIEGWSDAIFPTKPIEDAICINNEGGYQFRLFPNGEENPALFDFEDMIPLYKYNNGEVIKRTAEEIEAERASLPVIEPKPTAGEQLRADIDYLAIMTGVQL